MVVSVLALAVAGCNTTRSADTCGDGGCITGSIAAPADIDSAVTRSALSEIQPASPAPGLTGASADSVARASSVQPKSSVARTSRSSRVSQSRGTPILRRMFARTADPVQTASIDEDAIRVIEAPAEEGLRTPVETAEPSSAVHQTPVRPRRELAPREGARDLDLPGAVSVAVAADPRVGLSRAQTEEAEAAVRGSQAALATKVTARIAAGPASTGDFREYSNIVETGTTDAFARADFGVSARKLIFDFQSTRENISRTEATARARQFELLEEIDNVALEMADAYLGVLQQRSLVDLSKKNLNALRELLILVETNEEAGNATVADVKRVSSRIIESETLLTDLESALDDSLDRFRRLARIDAGQLQPPPKSARQIPPTVEEALATIGQTNPRLLALDAVGVGIAAELKSQRAQRRGRLEARVDASVNNQVGTETSTETDVRGLLVFTADIFDGGASQSLSDQIMARDRQNDMRYRRVREELEANLRQFYRAIRTARSKTERLRDGVADSAKVNELYIEQFQAGKRTIFELLDSQTALFTAERELVVNQYVELRAVYQILRATGTLTTSLMSYR